ncbi:MAG: phosphoribosylamine--glycine ligase, partial [Oscillospiraceae bacterium]|nr:phosphoribosylamine--glycine ligase [Oscillospiraceae bacterium]
SEEEAQAALYAMMRERVFGKSGERVVVEEFLTGPEVSVLCFTDGKTIKPMASAMDHKQIYDGNKGPNTGGMGIIAPNRYYTEETAERCMREIFLPTMRAMNSEGRTFRGCLYFGLMLTTDGPKVIEYNCRFGDPEAQAVLPLLETDLLSIVEAVSEGRLSEIEVKVRDGHACCVVMASGGYPGKYEVGKTIDFGGALNMPGIEIFHAGTAQKEGKTVTSGGRVLGVTAVGTSRSDAIELAYSAVKEISFEDAYYRKDIGRL